MTSLPNRQRFPKSAHVRSRLDFAVIYERGLRVSDATMSLILLPNDRGLTRLGLAVSKRCGNAVQRNRLKRRLREAFRLSRAELPTALDLVLQPRAGAELPLAALRQSLVSLTKRAAKKWASQPIASQTTATPGAS